jgi:hypothetical protein
MLLIACSVFLALFAIALVGVNWHIAVQAVRVARNGAAYGVSQIHLLPELALLIAALLWRTQLPLAQFGWFALLLVIADVSSWVVAAKARPRTSSADGAL